MRVSGGATRNSAIGSGQLLIKGGMVKYTGSTTFTTSQSFVFDNRFSNTFEVTTAGTTLTLNNVSLTNLATTASIVENVGGAGNIIITTKAIGDAALGTATAINKTGNGSLTFTSVTNTYTGGTTVTGGSLILSGTGSINSNSGLSVLAGATITNNSSVAYTKSLALTETAAINGTGKYTPGSSSTVTINGDLKDGFTTFSLGSATLTEGGSLVLNLANLVDGTYTLFSGGTINGAFTSLTIDGAALTSTGSGDFASSWATFTGSTTQLVITPEPGCASFAGVGLASAALRRRRRRL